MSIWLEAENAFATWLNSDVTYHCCYCSIDFQKKETLFKHIQEVHKVSIDKYVNDNPDFVIKKQPIPCDLCQSEIANASEHFREHHPEHPLELYFLRFVFCSTKQYQSQELTQSEERNGTQEEGTFSVENDYMEYPGECEENRVIQEGESDYSIMQEPTHDGFFYPNNDNGFIAEPVNIVYSGETIDTWNGNDEQKRKSNTSFDNNVPSSLVTSTRVNEKLKHSCSLCGYSSFNVVDVRKHIRKHTGEKPFSCTKCLKAFTQSSSLFLHMRSIHRA